MKTKVMVSLSPEAVALLDKMRARFGLTRSAWLEMSVRGAAHMGPHALAAVWHRDWSDDEEAEHDRDAH